ncbi:MAG: YihY/virulence factor BrkB family protein [Proteobacteria bacterium]|nr:YihY/virulence factor BrkB family protein [Pseudomonadota bacterium]
MFVVEMGAHFQEGSVFVEVRKFIRALKQGSSKRGRMVVSAGHLTFISLVSVMPLLGVALGIIQWFYGPRLSLWLMQWVQSLVEPGMHARTEAILQRFFSTFSSVAMGSVSFFFLLLSAVALLQHLEAAFNEIWGTSKRKHYFTRGFSYLAVLLLGPVAIGVLLSGSILFRRLLEKWEGPWLSFMGVGVSIFVVLGGLVVLYRFLPQVAVSWRAAFLGALGAGMLWELARSLYQGVARSFYQANVVWGSLGAFPLFLTWLYLSWYILLLGARLAYAWEHRNFQEAFKRLHMHPRAYELIGARIAKEFSLAGLEEPQALSLGILAKRLKLPEQRVEEVVLLLLKAEVLEWAQKEAFLPTKPLTELTLADISLAVGAMPSFYRHVSGETQPSIAEIEKLFFSIDEDNLSRLRGMNWAALANL